MQWIHVSGKADDFYKLNVLIANTMSDVYIIIDY
mgnify:CR=1 FL=1